MPSLCFPNPDALRLALAAGIVPADLAGVPVAAAIDDAGKTWFRLPEGFPKDVIASLARIGVTLHGPGVAGPLLPQPNWPALVPLKAEPLDVIRGPVLLSVPDRELASIAAEVQRLHPQPLGVRLLPDSDRSWLLIREPPLSVLLRLHPANGEAFLERAPRVWIAAGWRHPLESLLTISSAETAIVRPGRHWVVIPHEPFGPTADGLQIPLQPTAAWADRPSFVPLQMRFQLRPARPSGDYATLWIFPAERAELVAEFTKETDERVLNKIAIAFATIGEAKRILIRVAVARDSPGIPLSVGPGYVEHPELRRLYLPAGRALTPRVRPEVLARSLDVRAGNLVWLEPDGATGWVPHAVPVGAFRPIGDVIHYRATPTVVLKSSTQQSNPFVPNRFIVEPERTTASLTPQVAFTEQPSIASEGWLGRLTGKLFPTKPTRGGSPSRPRPPTEDEPSDAEGRASDKLTSPQTLLLGNEWAARRSALEQAVLTELAHHEPSVRAGVWSELADVYAAVGNAADASVCWANALWERHEPSPAWSAAWLRCEARAARLGKEGQDLTTLLRGAGSAAAARTLAAYVVWAAEQPQLPADFLGRLPRILAVLDRHEADLPVRMVWLARLAVARLSDGDALGLARSRDRIVRRLADDGPGLDLDAPSFLRFRGVSGGDRFQTAREWLVRIRDSVHRWIGRLAGPGRLQWAGIDPDASCTTAYADLLLAWGLSRLGDRSRAKDLEAQSTATLTRAGGHGVDPAVHRVLLAAFVDRIRTAQDGRADRPGLPMPAAAELARLDDLGRYTVDKLRAHSGILEPIDRVNPYRGRDLGTFLGSDGLGDRLNRLLVRPDLAPDPAVVRDLLGLAATQPIASVLPRVTFTLFELAPRLDAPAIAELLAFAARAMDLVPEWHRMGASQVDAGNSSRKFESRILAGACHAASLANQVEAFRRLTRTIAGDVETPGSAAGIALESTAGPFFRTLRRLGLTTEAADILTRFDRPSQVGPRDLGCAIGWYAIGAEEMGNRILNGARERLFVKGISGIRDRTSMALSYAAALAHAPPRLALGRLEEIFLRLESVIAHGATNRYFTLKPLELVDTVVRAVASDDFSLGPGVRGWLDDDEFAIRRRIARDLEAGLANTLN